MAKGFEHESDTITEVNCEKSYINILWNGLIWKCPESGRLIKSLVGETKSLNSSTGLGSGKGKKYRTE